jgi:hypothetical protein
MVVPFPFVVLFARRPFYSADIDNFFRPRGALLNAVSGSTFSTAWRPFRRE